MAQILCKMKDWAKMVNGAFVFHLKQIPSISITFRCAIMLPLYLILVCPAIALLSCYFLLCVVLLLRVLIKFWSGERYLISNCNTFQMYF